MGKPSYTQVSITLKHGNNVIYSGMVAKITWQSLDYVGDFTIDFGEYSKSLWFCGFQTFDATKYTVTIG